MLPHLLSSSRALGMAVFAFSAAPIMASYETPEARSPARVEITSDGPTLVAASNGMTLYSHSGEDSHSDKFRWLCTNVAPRSISDEQSGLGERPSIGFQHQKSCIDKFPPFLASANTKPAGDYSFVARPDGTNQWAYRGFPLYFSVKDHKTGDRNGGVGGLFGGGGRFGGFRLAAAAISLPMGLRIITREEGAVFATAGNDRPVYTPRNKRTRIDEELFRPMIVPEIASVSGHWSVVTNGVGRRQYAYKGRPLYAAPLGMSEYEVAASGQWDLVVFQRAGQRPPEIGKRMTLVGEVFTDRSGKTLYNYSCSASRGGGPGAMRVSCDDAGDPAGYMVALCGDSASCAERWKPYVAPANAKPVGDWAPVEITYPMFTDPRGVLYPGDAPHVRAWAYRGNPVFTYYEDEKPGDIWGNGMKGLWGSSFTAAQPPGKNTLFE